MSKLQLILPLYIDVVITYANCIFKQLLKTEEIFKLLQVTTLHE